MTRLQKGVPVSLAVARLLVLGALVMAATQRMATAITINMVYSDEGSTPPHSENPSWDPDGSILKAHFQRAKQLWEALLPGPGEYEFDFHWDDDIGGALGMTTDLGPFDVFIEINPNANWFADPTPFDDDEFDFSGGQAFFSQLTAADQANFFPGTPPPGALEVRYVGTGISTTASASGQPGINALTGFDLLSTIVHEIGHVLGISGVEPGEYNIYPHHVGGLSNVLVLEGEGGHLAGDNTVPGFLMCDGCGAPGMRRLPTATDVLVIAEDQGLSELRLARVGRISNGLWNNANAWIGGVVPGLAQDVYIRDSLAVALAENAHAKNLRVTDGSSLSVQGHRLEVDGALNFDGGILLVGVGGVIAADTMDGSPNALITTSGSLVRFNSFSPGSSSATLINFNGSVAIGHKTPSSEFEPTTITQWNIAEQLSIGDENTDSTLTISGGTVFTSDSGRIGTNATGGGQGTVTIREEGSSWAVAGMLDARSGVLNVEQLGELSTGAAALGAAGGELIATVNNAIWIVAGDFTVVPTIVVGTGQAQLTIQNLGNVSVLGNLDVQGSSARTSEIVIESQGRLNVNGEIFVRSYGAVTYKDGTTAGDQEFRVEPRGRVSFLNFTSALDATFENQGAAVVNTPGGVTEFRSNSGASSGTFTNRGSGFSIGIGRTVFYDIASAASASFENVGGDGHLFSGGATEFRDDARAGNASFINHGSAPGFSADGGVTRFYDRATAGSATFEHRPGPANGGRTEFHGQSTAGSANLTIAGGSSAGGSRGGAILFRDDSSAGQGRFTIEPWAWSGAIVFNQRATASDGTFVLQDRSQARVQFFDEASAGNATFDIGNNGLLQFFSSSTAADATITIRNNGNASFNGQFNSANLPTATAANAEFDVNGADAPGGGASGNGGGNLGFSTWSTAGNATIRTNGGTVAGAAGGITSFDHQARAGDATLIANAGMNGGAGGRVSFLRGAKGDRARAIAHAGGIFDFSGNGFWGGTEIGSIEGAGTFILSSHLTTGNLDTSTTVSGQLIDVPSLGSGSLTKVGNGTLTLAGANSHSGLTTIDSGRIHLTGSLAGGAVVNSGGILTGTGSIDGTVKVNSGGLLAPGASLGAVHVGGLDLGTDGILAIELAGTTPGTQYDQLIASGGVSLAGTLLISLSSGFIPAAGQSFNILDWSSLTGSFASLVLPNLVGLFWDTTQLHTSGVLNISSVPQGDFNQDGMINAADYVLWRKIDGTPAGYAAWRANFGNVQGGGSAMDEARGAAIPEPSTFAIALLVSCVALGRRSSARKYPLAHE